MTFDAKQYWEDRLTHQFDLCGTGTLGFSRRYVRLLYKLKAHALSQCLRNNSIQIRDSSLLDIGSGTGFFIEFYSRFNPAQIVGLDITQVSVDQLAERFPRYQFARADIGEPLDLGQVFDIINAQDVFYHIVDDQKFAQAMTNLDRFSHPGSILLFSEVFDSETIAGTAHVKFRSSNVYEQALKHIGFQIQDVRPIYGLMNLPLFHLPAKLLSATAPLLFAADRLLLPLGFHRKNNTKLILCEKLA